MSNNIKGIIKSLIYSDRSITPKNIKFHVLREILKSEEFDEIIKNKNGEMKKILIYYKNEINNEKSLKDFDYYMSKVNAIRQERLNKIMNGNINKVVYNRLKKMYQDEDFEKEMKDRGIRHFKVKNDTLKVKIITLEDLEYQLKMMQLDAINNIITTYEQIKSTDLENWYENIKKYTIQTYGQKPVKNEYKLFLGENNFKSEEYLLFHCLTNDKVYCVKRTKMKF